MVCRHVHNKIIFKKILTGSHWKMEGPIMEVCSGIICIFTFEVN